MKPEISCKNTVFLAVCLVFCPLGASRADVEDESPPTIETEIEFENGWISISTKPYAEVYVDGVKVGNTPVSKEPVPAGRHHITLVNKNMGVDISVSVEVSNKQHVKIVKDLKKIKPPFPPVPPIKPIGKGWLSVNSSPPATVYVDNEKIGLTPLFKIPLKAGKHEVQLVNEEFDIQDHFKVTIKKGKTKKVVKTYDKKEKYGKLSVTSTPHAKVYIDGNKIGSTPISKYNLEPGSYKITLVNDQMGINYTTSVTILKGKTTKVVKTFKKIQEKGTLTVTSVPWTTVFVDGKKAGNTPLMNYHVEPGLHMIKLVNKSYGIVKVFQVSIKKGKNTRIEKNFSKDSI